jgi:Oxidoreductase family, NAD-binding Rossmann fold
MQSVRAIQYHHFIKSSLLMLLPLFNITLPTQADEPNVNSTKIMRVGIIGLDTSHAPAFTKAMNDPAATGPLSRMQVVAAFPAGSPDIKSSADRVEGYTKELKDMGVDIVNSVDELVSKVDAVMVESLDGRPHLPQALAVFRAGKPCYIDKPLAGSLSDAIAIDLLAKKYKTSWFSSSSLRFSPSIYRFRQDPALQAKIRGALAFSPCPTEPTHPDLFWYGVHGVESLFTIMGAGCKQVTRVHSEECDEVVGLWSDGRIGSFRGIRKGRADYGAVVFLDDAIDSNCKFEGYTPLVEQIGAFFETGEVPVSPAETIEIFAFMQAADQSKLNGGTPISIQETIQTATIEAEKRIAEIEK